MLRGAVEANVAAGRRQGSILRRMRRGGGIRATIDFVGEGINHGGTESTEEEGIGGNSAADFLTADFADGTDGIVEILKRALCFSSVLSVPPW